MHSASTLVFMVINQPFPLISFSLAILATDVSGESQRWEVRSETVYSTGDFGSDITTRVLYAPLEIRRRFDWGELGVAVPYLWYQSNGNYTYVDESAGFISRTIEVSGNAEGLTDLLIDAEYRLLSQSGNRPEVLLHGYWKPPTADKDDGLGSGTNDWIIGTEIWSWIPGSERWLYFGDIYRYFAGEARGRNVRDSWIYDCGIGYIATPKLLAKLSYAGQSSVAQGVPSAQSVNLETEFKVNSSLKLLSEISLGMSDASPDWSLMLGFEQAF